jgi:hypothetical protein
MFAESSEVGLFLKTVCTALNYIHVHSLEQGNQQLCSFIALSAFKALSAFMALLFYQGAFIFPA